MKVCNTLQCRQEESYDDLSVQVSMFIAKNEETSGGQPLVPSFNSANVALAGQ